jgi:hypothetical protein
VSPYTTLKVETVCFIEMLISTYTQYQNPEKHHLHHCENLKSRHILLFTGSLGKCTVSLDCSCTVYNNSDHFVVLTIRYYYIHHYFEMKYDAIPLILHYIDTDIIRLISSQYSPGSWIMPGYSEAISSDQPCKHWLTCNTVETVSACHEVWCVAWPDCLSYLYPRLVLRTLCTCLQ